MAEYRNSIDRKICHRLAMMFTFYNDTPETKTMAEDNNIDQHLPAGESMIASNALHSRDQAVKSDGGSSSYYELEVPQYVLNRLARQERDCEVATIETGDVIRMLVDNDFDAGNIIKALRRIIQAKKGIGKAGTDIKYDINKVKYFISEIERTLPVTSDSRRSQPR